MKKKTVFPDLWELGESMKPLQPWAFHQKSGSWFSLHIAFFSSAPKCSPYYKDSSYAGLWPQMNDVILILIGYAKIQFPNKVAFAGN